MFETLYEVIGLKKYFPVRGGILSREVANVQAVDDATFQIIRGEILGLVGESGCGKTTLGRCVMLLLKPTAGQLIYSNQNLVDLSKGDLQKHRRKMSMIFQDPYSSLNPRFTVADIVGEPLTIHKMARGREKEEILGNLLKRVGLAAHHMYRYPHELSGGQKQRVGIARALAINPEFVVADEPVASLDISVRASILNLMKNLKRELGLTYMFISHDLSVVRYLCDRVMVMYLGKIVETANTSELFTNPKHPYTQALISAIPVPDPTKKIERIVLHGDVPTPINPPSGCRFHPRCRYAMEICSKVEPQPIDVSDVHSVACHLVEQEL